MQFKSRYCQNSHCQTDHAKYFAVSLKPHHMKHCIIIPAFNAAQYIVQCVQSALDQLGKSDKIIIVNDGSTDDTQSILASMTDPKVTVLSLNQNQGIAAARNFALVKASGDYIHFLDHDDLWPSDRMEVINKIAHEKKPDIISGWVEHFFCPSLSFQQSQDFALPANQAAALPGSVVFSYQMIQRLGLLDVTLTSGEFVDYVSRAMMLKPNWVKTQHVLLRRRIHGNNHTLVDQQADMSYLTVIRRHMARASQS
jgi:glycosyltransferase involved in cell wall biosynthesis